MPRLVKHTIKYRSERIEDIEDVCIEIIEYSVDNGDIVSIQRDAWEPLEVEEVIIHRVSPNGSEKWETKPTYTDPEWESEITVYADE